MIKAVDIKKYYLEYEKLLKSDSYISKKIYDYYLSIFNNIDNNNVDELSLKIKDIIDSGYETIDVHNQNYLKNKYNQYKNYFENMYKDIDENIKLDEEQIKAILADEDYALIIAGAGTGKTTTMASKVKYLVDKKNVDPSRILVMSYTKKATMELEDRIVNKFNIPAYVTTFHSLGYNYIKKIFDKRKCIVVDQNNREEIFLNYFKKIFEDKDKMEEIISSFSVLQSKKWMFSKFFSEHYKNYKTYDEFFTYYKRNKMEEAKNVGLDKLISEKIESGINGESIRTIKNEIVKSKAEAIIANFLFIHGIDYKYEKVYSEIMDNNSPYRPDFTLDLAGQSVYLEYFGLNNQRYNYIRKMKEEYHKNKNNRFISLDNNDEYRLEQILDEKLQSMGFIYRMKTSEEIYEQMLNNNPLSQLYPFKNFIFDCIDCIKSSPERDNYKLVIEKYLDSLPEKEKKDGYVQFNYINDFYRFYQKYLYGAENYYFDYPDLLYYANKYINNITDDGTLKFEYIIIDEYQDISKEKYTLAKLTADRSHAKVFAVGDDWQSIYAFSGSRIEYIYNFNKYFKNAKLFKITNTYRNSQELIDVSGTFIMKNDDQIHKELKSNKHLLNPIKFVTYDSSDNTAYNGTKFYGYQEYICLEKLILKIHSENPEHNILVLGRTNAMIDRCFKNEFFKDDLGTKITFVGYEDINLEGMTMHKSKGLTFDEVIIIGLNNAFPNASHYSYWLINLLKNPVLEENIDFAEERRLFYVALTRTKNSVYLLTDINAKKRSKFVDEIYKIVIDKNN